MTNLCATGATRDGGQMEKLSLKDCASLFLMLKPLNSKVIKGFVPELRNCYMFFEFQDSYVLWIYVMNILCTFHVFVYGYVTLIYLVPGAKTCHSWHDYELGSM